MELKKPLTLDEQVAKLEEHGMVFSNKDAAKKILSEINYYRFTGYALQYRKDVTKSAYVDGLEFDSIYRIYQFDEKLRNILRLYIEQTEIYYRTQISYGFSLIKCADSPHDQHYDANNFYKKQGYQEVMDSLKKEKNYYKDSLIVKHHKAKYNNFMPLWVIVELLSFSNISKLFNSMYLSEQEEIANNIGISVDTLENHLHCLSVLRNKCAHAARLYNTEFYPPARFTKQFLRKNPSIKNSSLFAYVLVLLKRLPDEDSKNEMIKNICDIIDEFNGEVDLSDIGFPVNYIDCLNNNCK